MLQFFVGLEVLKQQEPISMHEFLYHSRAPSGPAVSLLEILLSATSLTLAVLGLVSSRIE